MRKFILIFLLAAVLGQLQSNDDITGTLRIKKNKYDRDVEDKSMSMLPITQR
jgi:hypothetical protein